MTSLLFWRHNLTPFCDRLIPSFLAKITMKPFLGRILRNLAPQLSGERSCAHSLSLQRLSRQRLSSTAKWERQSPRLSFLISLVQTERTVSSVRRSDCHSWARHAREDNIAVGDIMLISEPREVCFIYLLLKSFLTFIRLVLGALDDRNCHVSFTSTQ